VLQVIALHDTARVRLSTRAIISSAVGPAPLKGTMRTSIPLWRRFSQVAVSEGNSSAGITTLSPGRHSSPCAQIFIPCDVLLVRTMSFMSAPIRRAIRSRTPVSDACNAVP